MSGIIKYNCAPGIAVIFSFFIHNKHYIARSSAFRIASIQVYTHISHNAMTEGRIFDKTDLKITVVGPKGFFKK